jgi:hypothetical protein
MKRPHILLGSAFTLTMLISSLSGLQAAPSPINTPKMP